ncbi:P-loop containing nucleoside triphosphate hydrolase protein [Lactarius psammicola]|nr:P-loop containing nucleoside triphosphate hydrolase protein [Lactarius psammicola]
MKEAVNDRFGFFPCTWQLKAALTQLEGTDLLTLAPTGSGKTLTFWIPLLFNGAGISIVVTPLNVLGEKNVSELALLSIPAVNLTTSSASDKTFKEIESLKFRVVITSPECILTDRRFLDLWKSKRFVKKLRSVIFDEAHCISQWSGEFRPEYADVGRLRWLLPAHVVFYGASATMPCHILDHVKALLQMRAGKTREIRLTNDRPNIHLVTLEMLDPLNSCHDILRVFNFNGDPPPPPFMVFCNDRKETERLCQFARSHAPAELIDKLRKIWGIFCTDAAGMGLDIRNIEIVIQWRYTSSLCTLWQRLGRAARDPSNEASGIYFVEPQYMDHHRKAAVRIEKAQQKRLQGATESEHASTRKKARTHDEKAGPSTRKKTQLRQEPQPERQQWTHISTHDRGGSVAAKYPMSSSRTGLVSICVSASRLCCDTCNPGSFILPIPTTSAPKQTRAPNKFKAGQYKLTNTDLNLTSALQDWRNAQLRSIGILTGDDMYGSQLIMPDDVLERIVELAHFNQLADLASIRAQVNWRYSDLWGTQILDLVKIHVPTGSTDSVDQLGAAPSPCRSMTNAVPGPSNSHRSPGVQSSATTTAANSSAPKPRTRTRSYKCSACGSSSHIGMHNIAISLYRRCD